MRRNAERVSVLRNDIINEIKDFMNSNQLEQIEFENLFVATIDVTTESAYDLGTEEVTITKLTNDGIVIDTNEFEYNLSELKSLELAWVLDELEDRRFNII